MNMMLQTLAKTSRSSASIRGVKYLSTSTPVAPLSSKHPPRTYVLPPPLNLQETYRFQLTAKQLQNQPDTVKKALSLTNASAKEVLKAKLQQAIMAFQRFPGDTGSSEVQIAILTQKIEHLSSTHFNLHRKDFHSKRGLIGMIQQRKKLLQYLKRTELQRYKAVVVALGLRV